MLNILKFELNKNVKHIDVLFEFISLWYYALKINYSVLQWHIHQIIYLYNYMIF